MCAAQGGSWCGGAMARSSPRVIARLVRAIQLSCRPAKSQEMDHRDKPGDDVGGAVMTMGDR
ncbi:hypothetical protein SAMN02745223_01901 [Devosia limi DSM 17137]|uniref:Uncharacterized protein n=1 Tax=Devosia limi DSM 17137 TaxID=1121477 RepID=A0A1M4ZD87_9HYPH|nr:hypothetical protein SAMN02745223_01901 [Devosia limi DSM 17137]